MFACKFFFKDNGVIDDLISSVNLCKLIVFLHYKCIF